MGIPEKADRKSTTPLRPRQKTTEKKTDTTTPKRKKIFQPSGIQKTPPDERSTSGVDEVSPDGDLVLVLEHELVLSAEASSASSATTNYALSTAPDSNADPGISAISSCTYMVKCDALRALSPYFRMLLDPNKFGEGKMVADAHKSFDSRARSLENLPHITISNVGRISPVKSIGGLMGDFLRILHGGDMTSQQSPLVNIANLCIVADRFDAIDTVKQYLKSRRTMQLLDGKLSSQAMASLPEERTRQRLLVGLFLDNSSWTWHASKRLILQGWVGREEVDGDSALWWDLPMGIENELLFRRECILDTLQSLQSYFLELYCSRERQCKLGYDSSAECDIYQLGQMIRFFKKISTLSLTGTMLPPANDEDETMHEPYQGDVFGLIESIRQCPEYQIDKNHHHCGLRQRLMPPLEDIEFSLNNEIAINLSAWLESRPEYAWTLVKRPLIWKIGNTGASMIRAYNNRAQQSQRASFRYLETRDMFMAKQRIWS